MNNFSACSAGLARDLLGGNDTYTYSTYTYYLAGAGVSDLVRIRTKLYYLQVSRFAFLSYLQVSRFPFINLINKYKATKAIMKTLAALFFCDERLTQFIKLMIFNN